MTLTDLREKTQIALAKKMDIKQSLSIINIPKQNFLDKGNLVILLNPENEAIVSEWLKDEQYHIGLKNQLTNETINKILQLNTVQLFETDNFDAVLDMDYVVNYSDLKPDIKNLLKEYIKLTETNIIKTFTRFGKTDKVSWVKNIQAQNGSFTSWREEKGYTSTTNECIREAYNEAEMKHDYLLKKRASFAKCFLKITNFKSKL